MNNIKLFNSVQEQRDYLEFEADYNQPHLSYNLESKEIKHTKDITNGLIFKYANDDGNLNNYRDVNYGCNNKYTIVPKEVSYINVYNKWTGELVRQEEVNHLKEDPIYKVGLLSDIHYNDSDTDQDPDTFYDDGSEYSQDLQNALSVFNEHGVDFITCAGDITLDSRKHFRNYKLCVDKYGYNIPIYTCTGNHDTKPADRAREEWMTIDSINSTYDLHRIDDPQGTSFYFVKELENNKKDVYIYLNISYGYYDECSTEEEYNNTRYDTHYPRLLRQDELLVHSEVEEFDFHLYSPATLTWLANVLEEYKNDRCFIFTHLMFGGNKAGSYHGSEGYYDYVADHYDYIRGDQGMFLENLLENYDNNYWFCGHSHYKWIWEKYDHTINVTKTNNSWNIHLPSLSRPLLLKRWYQTAPQDAEGAIMEVYNDYVVIKGIVFKEENIDDISSKLTQLPDNETIEITKNMFIIPEGSATSIESGENGELVINTSYDGSNIYLNPGNVNSSNYDNLVPVLRIDELYILNDDGLDLTDEVLPERTIGFRDTISDSAYRYYLESNHIYNLYSNGLLFKISSQSSYKNINLHIHMKARIGFIDEGYTNKFLPIAIFKL